MIGILRYSAGNTRSVQRAFERLGIPVQLVETREEILSASGLVFPGAGSANAAMEDLERRDLPEVIRSLQIPFLGLCLGMQLLFDSSEEGNTPCLGIIRGRVRALPDSVTKPHMGWNKLSTGKYAYFVHSFVCEPEDQSLITMTTRYGVDICAGIRRKNFFGVQWHPEKSGDAGDDLLLSFVELCK
ncbi:MAG: imidazole glycerol phosphate synthase subunit HisH [Candidatus Peregrinibacteria bacterium]|nr:imidazole glycerol phosphate synthase subunit HisH [Candidatus Peregrinibacteria bacterium]